MELNEPSEPQPYHDTPTNADAGWYPVDAVSQRYWDGYEWTNHMAPLSPTGSPAGVVSGDDRTYCVILHLSSFLAGFIGPLILWAIKKDASPFVDFHGKQSMNFHLTLLIAGIVSFVLVFVLVGFFMLLALGVAYLVITILAAVAANRGEYYKFPLTIQFFK